MTDPATGGRAGSQRNLVLLAGVVCAFALRILALPLVTTDTFDFLLPWQRHADAVGAGYLARPFTNYAPAYEHVLALLSRFPGDALLRVKSASIAADLILAAAVALCCRRAARVPAFVLVLLLPTTIMNSSALGQADALWAAFVMLSLSAALRPRPVWAMLAFSAALAFKLQAVFFLPVLSLLWLERRQPWWTFALIPLGYVAAALPMLIAGRSLVDTFGVYAGQFGTFHTLAASAPNPWMIAQLVVSYKAGVAIGVPLAVGVVGATMLWLWRAGIARHGSDRAADLRTGEGVLLCAAILMILVPYALPKMHDRYFYAVDPILVALVAVDRSYWRELALTQTASVLSYLPFLTRAYGVDAAPYGFTAILAVLAMTAALVLLIGRAVRRAHPMNVAAVRDLEYRVAAGDIAQRRPDEVA